VQTTAPRYVAASAPRVRRKTGHAAIEIFAGIDDGEARLPALASALRIERVRIEGNDIDDAASDGIRIDEGGAAQRDGPQLHAVDAIDFVDNRIARVRGRPLHLPARSAGLRVACRGNTYEGAPTGDAACAGAFEPAHGASLACLRSAVAAPKR
jgi:hypothetical protein